MADDRRYIGRHHSKREVILASSEDYEKNFSGITKYTVWRYDIEDAPVAAIDYLRSKGIELITSKVWCNPSSDIGEYYNWPPPAHISCHYTYLDKYLRAECGFQRDDIEELCARIIVYAERLREKKK